jgi:hypothetical protein
MVVAVAVLAAVAVAAITAALVLRAELNAERQRASAAETIASERAGELATTQEQLTGVRSALATETSARAADTRRLEQLQVELTGAEQRAIEADQRARDAVAAGGVEAGVVWPLELQRSERVWHFSVSPGPQAESPLAATGNPLITALKVEVDAARNDVGANVELAADLPPDVDPATAVLVLRIAQELLADVVRRSETATLQVAIDEDDIVVAVEAVGSNGPVLPEPLPIESVLIEPIENGVRVLGGAPPVEQDPGEPDT